MPGQGSVLAFFTLGLKHVVSYSGTFGVELIHEKLVLLSTEMLLP
jgi:hypothetical protein